MSYNGKINKLDIIAIKFWVTFKTVHRVSNLEREKQNCSWVYWHLWWHVVLRLQLLWSEAGSNLLPLHIYEVPLINVSVPWPQFHCLGMRFYESQHEPRDWCSALEWKCSCQETHLLQLKNCLIRAICMQGSNEKCLLCLNYRYNLKRKPVFASKCRLHNTKDCSNYRQGRVFFERIT